MDDDINIFEMFCVIKKYWKKSLIIFLLVVAFGIISLLRAKPTYQASTSFLFPFSGKGGGSLSKLIGGASDIMGFLGIDTPLTMADYAKPILESRTITSNILDKYGRDIFTDYEKTKRVILVRRMKSVVKIEKGKDNIVEIKVVTGDPKLSADIANEYVREYQKYVEKSALSASKRKLSFARIQRDSNKEKLEKLEQQMKLYQENNQVVDVPEETKAMIQYYADIKTLHITTDALSAESDKTLDAFKRKLREQSSLSKEKMIYPVNDTDPKMAAYYAELTRLQVDLAMKKETLTDEHPTIKQLNRDVEKVQSMIRDHISNRLQAVDSNLTQELIQAEVTALSNKAKSAAIADVLNQLEKRMAKLPELGMEYGRILRDVKAYNQIYLYWEMELQKALAEEGRDPTDFQVLDKAVPPDHKHAPAIMLTLIITFVVACVMSIGSAFILDLIEKQKEQFLAIHKTKDDNLNRIAG